MRDISGERARVRGSKTRAERGKQLSSISAEAQCLPNGWRARDDGPTEIEECMNNAHAHSVRAHVHARARAHANKKPVRIVPAEPGRHNCSSRRKTRSIREMRPVISEPGVALAIETVGRLRRGRARLDTERRDCVGLGESCAVRCSRPRRRRPIDQLSVKRPDGRKNYKGQRTDRATTIKFASVVPRPHKSAGIKRASQCAARISIYINTCASKE